MDRSAPPVPEDDHLVSGTAQPSPSPGTEVTTPPTTATQGVRYCLGCAYELSGLELHACPECGRRFDPNNPATTGDAPIPMISRRRYRRAMALLAIVLTAAAAVMYTAVPIPVRGQALSLWVWLGRTYGVEEMWLSTTHVRARHWAGRVYEVEANDRSTGRVIWEIRSVRDERWTLRVDRQGVEWRDLVYAFNLMKDDAFCVSFRGSIRKASLAGFEAEGNKADILSAIVSHYGISVQSMIGDPNQSYVWYFDTTSRRMKTRSITTEEAAELPAWTGGDAKRLVPRTLVLPAEPAS